MFTDMSVLFASCFLIQSFISLLGTSLAVDRCIRTPYYVRDRQGCWRSLPFVAPVHAHHPQPNSSSSFWVCLSKSNICATVKSRRLHEDELCRFNTNNIEFSFLCIKSSHWLKLVWRFRQPCRRISPSVFAWHGSLKYNVHSLWG